MTFRIGIEAKIYCISDNIYYKIYILPLIAILNLISMNQTFSSIFLSVLCEKKKTMVWSKTICVMTLIIPLSFQAHERLEDSKLEAVSDNNLELVNEILEDITPLINVDENVAELVGILKEPHFQVNFAYYSFSQVPCILKVFSFSS